MIIVISDDYGGYKVYFKGVVEVFFEFCIYVVGMKGELKEFSKEDVENFLRDFIDLW